MKPVKSIQLAGILLSIFLFTACKKVSVDPVIDKTNDGTFKVFTEANVTTVQNLDSDTIIGIAATGQPFGAGKFTFFNLAGRKIVPNSDSATLNWDIAFRGTTIIVNSGTSGPGNGGAFVWQGIFSDLQAIPVDSVFKTDNGASLAVTTGSGKGWYNYNGPTNLVTPLPGRVLVIRTASGKFAKVEILNYYKKGITPEATASDDIKLKNQRYFTFRYVYQPDGSKNLK